MLRLGHDRQTDTRNNRVGNSRNVHAQVPGQAVTAQCCGWENPSPDEDIGLSIQTVHEVTGHDIAAESEEMADSARMKLKRRTPALGCKQPQ